MIMYVKSTISLDRNYVFIVLRFSLDSVLLTKRFFVLQLSVAQKFDWKN